MAIRVLIVDSYRLLREAVAFRLGKEMGLEVVGEAEDGRVAVHLAHELSPDVIIMDTLLPNLNGVEATRQIVHELPATKVVAFSGVVTSRSVKEMLAAGAAAYVPRNSPFEELLTAIRSVASNHTYLSPQICTMVVEGYVSLSADRNPSAYSDLTAREREVLQLIAEGKSTKVIAIELCLSGKTIEWHRSRIMKKLGIESIAGLVRYAMAEGLTSTDLAPLAASGSSLT